MQIKRRQGRAGQNKTRQNTKAENKARRVRFDEDETRQGKTGQINGTDEIKKYVYHTELNQLLVYIV